MLAIDVVHGQTQLAQKLVITFKELNSTSEPTWNICYCCVV